MRNNKIGEGLKRYRRQNQMTVNEVSIELQKRYHLDVAEKTIYGWESNQAHPTSDMFLLLCELYHITNVNEAFGNEKLVRKGEFRINSEERSLIEHYRAQPPTLQNAVKRILKMETDTQSK